MPLFDTKVSSGPLLLSPRHPLFWNPLLISGIISNWVVTQQCSSCLNSCLPRKHSWVIGLFSSWNSTRLSKATWKGRCCCRKHHKRLSASHDLATDCNYFIFGTQKFFRMRLDCSWTKFFFFSDELEVPHNFCSLSYFRHFGLCGWKEITNQASQLGDSLRDETLLDKTSSSFCLHGEWYLPIWSLS
jgi:hypothetical protein